jgi:hypothetical protein
MPRVVIELQANTEAAVQKIQQFAKAQKDAFDAVKAGNPTLAEAAIKVSTLQTAYAGATKSMQSLAQQAPATAASIRTITRAFMDAEGHLVPSAWPKGVKAMEEVAKQGPPTAASIKTITSALTDGQGAVVAYGTASAAQKAASAQFFDTLTSGAGTSQTALGGMNTAAKDLAKGGLRDLLSDIPIVGGALAKLAGTLGGFPLLLGAVAGAGIAVVSMLQKMSTEADQALGRMNAVAASMDAARRIAILEGQKAAQEGAGAAGPALATGAEIEVARAAEDRRAAIAAAQEKAKAAQPGLFSPESILSAVAQGTSGPLIEKQKMIAAELRQAEEEANETFALKVKQIQDNLKNDLKKQEKDYDQTLDQAREERLKKEADAAEKQKDAAQKQKNVLQETVREGLAMVKELGPHFEDLRKKLALEQFTAETRDEIEKLNRQIEMGADTNGLYTETVKALEDALQRAISTGIVPTAEATKAAKTALDEFTASTTFAADSVEALFGITGGPLLDTLNELIAKGREAQAAVAGATGAAPGGMTVAGTGGGGTTITRTTAGGGGGPTGVFGLDFTTLGGIAGQAGGSGLTPFSPSSNLSFTAGEMSGTGGGGVPTSIVQPAIETVQMFQGGGIVPGRGAVPIIAHGGEAVLPERLTQALAGGLQPSIHIHPGAIQIAGTFIDQQRAWGSMVEELGQALEARAMRR